MAALLLSWRLLRREARAGELRLLAAALVVAVAAATSIAFFADRIRLALEGEAHQLLGADLLLIADHPWRGEVAEAARRLGLRSTETRTFASMVGNGAVARLADIKAVGDAYPLRGQLRIAAAAAAPDAPAAGVPERGTVWLDERLAAALDAIVGQDVVIGAVRLRMVALLTQEPDRGIDFLSLAPRLLMNLDDLGATELIQVGSRVSYRLLVAGNDSDVAAFRDWIAARLERGERIEDAQNARPEIRTALERGRAFFGLAALLAVVLAAVAIAVAARQFAERHLDGCAVMRAFGASQGLIVRLHLAQLLMIGLAASLVGCGSGYLAHFALHAGLAGLLAAPLPAPSLIPALQGLAVGLLLLLGFALPPLLQLKRVPTLRVLRRELEPARPRLWAAYSFGLAGLAGLMFWIADDARLGAYVVGGFGAAVAVFWLLARAAIRLAQWLGGRLVRRGFGWRHGLAALERRAAGSVVQIVALALGIMALILLTVTRGELVEAWRRATPPDAPNRFVINIQPQQLESVRRFFAGRDLPAELSPMVRGRLVRIDGRQVAAASFDDERARRLVEREFNLSWRDDLPPGNAVSAGRWFRPQDRGRALASVEEGLARTLGIGVGDRLEFSIGGELVALEVAGLRKLDWDSMRVNFFVLAPSGVLERFPASYITSVHLPTGHEEVANGLVRDFPNLSVIDVTAILRQLQSLLDRLAAAVQFVFLFTLAAGIVVLQTVLLAAFAERRFELAVLRSLGARRAQLRQALLTEFAVIGAVAGAIGAGGATAVGEVLAQRVFHLDIAVDAWLLPLAALAGAVLVTAAGWVVARRLLEVTPLQALRP